MKTTQSIFDTNITRSIKTAAKILKSGGVVVFPTETVYGIGANAFDENAIKKIYEIKKRPLSKPISVLVSNSDMIRQVAENISDAEQKIIDNFFPGPLTLIVQKKECVPHILSSNGTLGIRMPDNEIALKLIDNVGSPLATTSANISGEDSQTNLNMLTNIFKDQVDYFIDGGESKIGIGSTVVQIINNKPHILREGTISLNDINAVIN